MEKTIALAIVMAYKIDSRKFDHIGFHHDEMILLDNLDTYNTIRLIEKHSHSDIKKSLEKAFEICGIPAVLTYPIYLADYWSNDLLDWAEEECGVSFCQVSTTIRDQYMGFRKKEDLHMKLGEKLDILRNEAKNINYQFLYKLKGE